MKAFQIARKTLPISKSLLLVLSIIAFTLPVIDFMSALFGLDSVSAYATDGALVNPQATSDPKIYISSAFESSVGSLSYTRDDIIVYDTGTAEWSLYLDGAAAGIPTAANVYGTLLLPDGTVLITFLSDNISLPGLTNVVDNSDIVQYDPSNNTFSLYFDGSDVGLEAGGESIDALALAPDGDLLFSTQGGMSASGASGNDEDIFKFVDSSLGENTSGTISMYFDGSDIGLDDGGDDEDVRGIWVDPSNDDLYLVMKDSFVVNGISGDKNDVIVCDTTANTCELYFDPNTTGMTQGAYALHIDLGTTAPISPTAVFTGTPTSGTAPLNVSFTNSSLNADSYSWAFGDGNSSTAVNPSHTYTQTGTYTVTLTATNTNGSDSLIRASYITVTQPVTPTADFTGTPTTGAPPLNVTFSNSSLNADSYSWAFGDGGSSTAINPSHTYIQTGVYSVTLTATNTSGSDSLTRASYITVTQPVSITVDFTGTPTSGSAPLDVTFSNFTIGASSYLWGFGDGGSSTATSPNHTYSQAGLYTVILTATNGTDINSLTRTEYISVTQPVSPTADFTGTPTSGTAPLNVTFSNSSLNADSYSWVFGDGNSSTAVNPTHTYTQAGTYTVTLTATNGTGSDSLTRASYISVTQQTTTRVNDRLLVLYSFQEGSGTTVQDVSGISPALPLTISNTNAVTWGVNGGLTVNAGTEKTIISSAGAAIKVIDGVKGSNEVTIEAWITPDNITQEGPARIVNLAGDASNRNVMLGQGYWGSTSPDRYTVRLRTTTNNLNGDSPPTKADAGTASTALTHVVYTRDASGNVAMYIDGVGVGTDQTTINGNLSNWDDSYGLSLADEFNSASGRDWAGTFHLVAIYDKALNPAEVAQNYNYGETVGEAPTANFSAAPLSGTAPLTVTFSNSSLNADSYSWDFGNGSSSTTVNPTHTYTQTGTYTVTLTATNTSGSDSLTRASYITVTQPVSPTADFIGTPTNGAAPLNVNFTNSSLNADSYSWAFGDGNSSTAVNPSHTYTQTGVYSVTLIATNASGSDSLTRASYITVTQPVTPTADFTGTPTSGNAPLNVSFTNSSLNADSYSWAFGDGNSSTAVNPSHTYTQTGVYSVTLIATNASGSDSLIRSSYITVTQPVSITVDFTGTPTSGTSPLNVTFSNATVGASSYLWDFGDGGSSTEIAPNHTYNQGGLYTVILTATNGTDTNSLTRTDYISVTQPVSPTADFTGTPTSGNAPLNVSFTNSSLNADSYSWAFGDGNSSTDVNPSHTYIQTGVYSVTLTATNAIGSDSLTRTDYISVTQPVSPTADFTGTPTSGNAPLNVSFTNSSLNADSYSWAFGDGNSSTAVNPSHTYTQAGVYSVTLIATNASGSDSLTRASYITVTQPVTPTADFTGMPTSGNAPLNVSFTNSSLNADNYSWAFGDGNSSTAVNPTHTYTQVGTYTVTLTATNASGSDSFIQTNYITVTSPPPASDPKIYISSAFESSVGSLSYTRDDIIVYDTGTAAWSIYLDGAAAGIPTAANIYGNVLLPDGTILITFLSDNISLPGLTNAVDNSDIVQYDPSNNTFSLYFDGSDVGLEAGGESIDALGLAPDGELLFSTQGVMSASGASGNDEDIFKFVDSSLGENTSGTISMYFDGSSIGLDDGGDDEDVRGVWVDPSNDDLYLVTKNSFVVNGVSGDKNDVFVCDTTANTCELYFDPNTTGMTQNAYALHIDLGTTAPISPTADFTGTPTSGAAPLNVSFTNTSLNADSYSWTFGDGNSSTAVNPSHTYTQTGVYSVTLTATNTSGSDSLTRASYITITQPVSITVDFTGTPTSGSAPLDVTFSNFTIGASSYLWDFGDGGSSTATSPNHTYNQAGLYTVILTATNGTDTNSLTRTEYISVTQPVSPTADFTGTPTSGTAPLNVSFTNNSQNADSYSWAFGDGNSSTAVNPTHTYTQAGTYTVTLTATNGIGSDSLTRASYITVTQQATRVSDGLLVLYSFQEGSGSIVQDVSGISPALPLTISNTNAATWGGSGGLTVNTGTEKTIIASTGAATKVIDGVKGSNEVTIEAWITPDNITQEGPARIVNLAGDPSNRNVMLGQGYWGSTSPDRYTVRLRTTTNNLNGDSPPTKADAGTASTALTHVVYTRDASGNVAMYINGVAVGTDQATINGNLSNWDDSYGLSLADEFNSTSGRDWAGTFHLVAIYDKALTPAEVDQNYNYGEIVDDSPTDSAWQEFAKLLPNDGEAYDYFGSNVAISGNIAIVGASSDDDNGEDAGAAYIFSYVGNSWSQQAKLTASDGATYDNFGKDVATDGNTAVIGASSSNGGKGAAYVFTFNGSTWTEQAKLVAADGADNDYFSESVAISGDTAVIGARGVDDLAIGAGAAYIFNRDNAIWTQQAKLTASDGAANDLFGGDVAIDGNMAVIGAHNSNDDKGAAYVFSYDGQAWVQQAKLIASDGAAEDTFGTAVAISGNIVVVGNYYDDDLGTNSGSAYVFNYDGTTWSEQAKLTAADGASYDFFGEDVAVSGETIIIGAYSRDEIGVGAGAAYLFSYNGNSWTQQTKFLASDGSGSSGPYTCGDNFGDSVGISGNNAIIGAPCDGDLGEEAGSAYIFTSGETFASWQQVTTANGVSVWGEYGLAYDTTQDVAVLYGGNATGWPYENSTWEYDGQDWSEVATVNQPNAVYGMDMVYDSNQNHVVLFGGSNALDAALAETWQFTGGDWIPLSPTASPPKRTNHAMIYDTLRQTTYLFGGNDNTTYFNDIWSFDGTTWSQVVVSGALPVARTLHAMAYDQTNNTLLLYGGRDANGNLLADTWVFDPATNTWSEDSDASPPARQAHSMAYDLSNQRFVLVGGIGAGEARLNDTWIYEAGNWQLELPPTNPPPLLHHQLIYADVENGFLVVTNGETWLFK